MKRIFIAAILSTGCASIEQQTELPLNLLNNRASMKFSAEGKEYTGVATLQRRAGIGVKINFKLPENTILFQLDNCAREHVKVRPKSSSYTYYYNPSIFKEAEDSCIMQAQATTSKGEIVSSIIDWTDFRRLKARVWCNEVLGQNTTGVYLCQNRAGKLMWIEFDEPVVWATTENCNEPTSAKYNNPQKVFEIPLNEGFCAYGFMAKNRERYRLTTFGYTTIQEVNTNKGDK